MKVSQLRINHWGLRSENRPRMVKRTVRPNLKKKCQRGLLLQDETNQYRVKMGSDLNHSCMSDPPGILRLFFLPPFRKTFFWNVTQHWFLSHVPHGEIINRGWIESLVRMNAQHLSARWRQQMQLSVVLCKCHIAPGSNTMVMFTMIIHKQGPTL